MSVIVPISARIGRKTTEIGDSNTMFVSLLLPLAKNGDIIN